MDKSFNKLVQPTLWPEYPEYAQSTSSQKTRETKIEISFRSYILAIIKRRKLLVMLGKTRKNEVYTMQLIHTIEQWFRAYPDATEKQLAKYFLKHYKDFQYIIPGYGSSGFEVEKEKLETMKQLALNLTQLIHV